MKFERMRMIDTACSLVQGTIDHYNYYLRQIQMFECIFKVILLKALELDYPPGHNILPVLWCQEWFAIQKPRKGRYAKLDDNQMTFGSA